MGVVDVSDQRREYYGIGRSSKKWWKFILHFVLNVCFVNCFILYDLTNHPPFTAQGNRQLPRGVFFGIPQAAKCGGAQLGE